MTELIRDPGTGFVYAYNDGKLVGPIMTIGDATEAPREPSTDLWVLKHGRPSPATPPR